MIITDIMPEIFIYETQYGASSLLHEKHPIIISNLLEQTIVGLWAHLMHYVPEFVEERHNLVMVEKWWLVLRGLREIRNHGRHGNLSSPVGGETSRLTLTEEQTKWKRNSEDEQKIKRQRLHLTCRCIMQAWPYFPSRGKRSRKK